MRTIVWVAMALAVAGCNKKDDGGSGKGERSDAVPGPCQKATVVKGPITWIEDNYDLALACARESKRPLVIDMWAPWCHTCLSMSDVVLRDPSLAPIANRYVFLAMDTDRPTNAGAVGKFALQNWPTYFVLDPADETIQARWLGAATATQFRQFLRDGEAATLAKSGGAALDPPLAKVREGDVAATKKDWATADAAYDEALRIAPPDWPRRSDVLVAQISARWKKGDVAGCLALASSVSPDQLGASANATDFLVWAQTCADHPSADPAGAKAVREKAAGILAALAQDENAPLSPDDRSDLLLNLRTVYDALGRTEEGKATATAQRALLDRYAAQAKTPMEAMTFNWHRAEVYVYLGIPDEIVPVLEKSIADLPREYDPPYRLAWVHLKAGRPADAARWARDAAGKAYGPRKVRVMGLLIEATKALGDVAAERAARAELVATLEGLSPSLAQPEALAKAKADLAAMDAGSGTASGSGSVTGSGSGSGSVTGSGSGTGTGSGSGSGSVTSKP